MRVPTTWAGLRGLDADREWMRFGELMSAARRAGVMANEFRVRQVIRRMPKPVKRHQMYQYTQEHLAAVLKALGPAAMEVMR